MEELKWGKQFGNLEKANLHLQKALSQNDFNDLEREGVIQRFEFTFELAWKNLQAYLEDNGHVEVKGPKKVIKQSFAEFNQGWPGLDKHVR